mmetsp:Transcript_54901/g.88687  ORF Transcript_54901/g.88687 Transcript_54901/m.88687 type:complete len:286 (-) Transcript_54901:1933-2790(-)
MDVVFQVVRNLKVDDQDHGLDVDASSSNRRRDQNIGDVVLEVLQREITILLILATVQGERRVAILQQLREHLIHILLLVDEDDDGAMLLPLAQELQQPIELLSLVENLYELRDVRGSRISFTNCDLNRLFQDLPGQSLHVSGQGCAEHCHLLVWSSGLQEHADLRLESHVKHAVGLVEDHEGDTPEVGDLAVGGGQDVDESPWSTHQELGPFLECGQLLAHGAAAVGADAREIASLAEDICLPLDLESQLPRRCDHEANWSVAIFDLWLIQDVPDHGQQVGQRLA